MKIALCVNSASVDSTTDPRFGRCNYFALADTENGQISFIANQEKEKGSGINAANAVLSLDVEAVIVGNIGPKAFKVLDRAGINIYEGIASSIQKSLELFNNGQLKRLSNANK